MATSSTFNNLRVNNAEQFKESVSEPANTRLYITLGRVNSWANDANPENSNASVASVYDVWRKMIGGKLINGSEISHVVPRFNWANGTTYIAYDHMNPNLYDGNTQFYVVTSSYGVYKCISNNYGKVSTVEPSYINSTLGAPLADGYVWKYMYSISAADQLNFLTSSYIPIKTLTTDDSSLQWQVQSNAEDGAVYDIIITNGGSNYTNVSNLSISITGDGSGFTATGLINTVSNTVSNVTISKYGLGYTYADVVISGGGGSGATGRAIISPPGGHGSNPLYELGGDTVMISPSISGTENGILPVGNDFRQVALLKDPYNYQTTTVASNSVFSQTLTLSVTGSGDYALDEYVYQGTSLATSTFRGRVVAWDNTIGTNNLKLNDILGTPVAGTLIGANSATARLISSIKYGDLKPYSGQLLYMDNIKPIIRSVDQSENFKIVFKF